MVSDVLGGSCSCIGQVCSLIGFALATDQTVSKWSKKPTNYPFASIACVMGYPEADFLLKGPPVRCPAMFVAVLELVSALTPVPARSGPERENTEENHGLCSF